MKKTKLALPQEMDQSSGKITVCAYLNLLSTSYLPNRYSDSSVYENRPLSRLWQFVAAIFCCLSPIFYCLFVLE
jgi:hypothetical protein